MQVWERYKQPYDLPAQIAVFPLKGCILLPRAILPLNIFEPRYLVMIDTALSTSRIIGIIQPAASSEARESPESNDHPLRQVGCAGRITSYQELPDGRCIIALTGIARFQTLSEVPSETPYRVWRVDFSAFASDMEPGRGQDQVNRDAVLGVLKSYVAANRLKADLTSITNSPSEFLVNTLSIVAPNGAEEKQALLEAADLRTRAETLVALAEMDLRAPGDGSGSAIQ